MASQSAFQMLMARAKAKKRQSHESTEDDPAAKSARKTQDDSAATSARQTQDDPAATSARETQDDPTAASARETHDDPTAASALKKAYFKKYDKERERKFDKRWTYCRDWLFNTEDGMKCKICMTYAKTCPPKRKNRFLTGCDTYK